MSGVSDLEIRTSSLTLRLESKEKILAAIEALSPAERAEISPLWLARLMSSTSADPWTHSFAMVNHEDGAVIGSCAFKGPPDQDGAVEIAYGVNPDYQGLGYATEAARALVEYAFATGLVRLVRAHTLPNENASTSVLKKCGFAFAGDVVDPEDGPVWRWELRDADAAGRNGPVS